MRRADGSYADYTVLDDAAIVGSDLRVGVGPAGHAVAVWPGGGFLRWATREPGGTFGPPVTSGVASDRNYPPERIGVDAQGRTIMVAAPNPVFPARFQLQARRGTVSAPFGEPVTLTAPDRDNGGGLTRFAIGAGGNAVLAWFDTQRFANRVARAAIATDGGPFSAPVSVPVDAEAYGAVEPPSVAIDGAGRAVLGWTESAGTVQRVLVAALTPTAVAGPTVVAQGALHARALDPGTGLGPQGPGAAHPFGRHGAAGAHVRLAAGVVLRDAAHRRAPEAGRQAHPAGQPSLHLLARDRSAPVVVRVTRAARRAAARRSLKGRITVTTTMCQRVDGVAFKDAVGVTVRRTRR